MIDLNQNINNFGVNTSDWIYKKRPNYMMSTRNPLSI